MMWGHQRAFDQLPHSHAVPFFRCVREASFRQGAGAADAKKHLRAPQAAFSGTGAQLHVSLADRDSTLEAMEQGYAVRLWGTTKCALCVSMALTSPQVDALELLASALASQRTACKELSAEHR